jgi:hypothetical protein
LTVLTKHDGGAGLGVAARPSWTKGRGRSSQARHSSQAVATRPLQLTFALITSRIKNLGGGGRDGCVGSAAAMATANRKNFDRNEEK